MHSLFVVHSTGISFSLSFALLDIPKHPLCVDLFVRYLCVCVVSLCGQELCVYSICESVVSLYAYNNSVFCMCVRIQSLCVCECGICMCAVSV